MPPSLSSASISSLAFSVLMFDSVPMSLKDSSGHTSRLSPRETAVADGNHVWAGGS